MCSKALNRPICGFSALLACALAAGSDLTEFRDSVAGARSEGALEEAMSAAPRSVLDDASLRYYFDESYTADFTWDDLRDSLCNELDARIEFEEGPGGPGDVKDAQGAAREILSNPLYTDREEREGRNWLDRAGSRLGERLFELLQKFMPDLNMNLPGLGIAPGTGGLTMLAWFLLGAAILLIVYFVVINFKGVGRRKKRIGGILEDDEPERTADQWLEQAERLQAEGRFREAVRCLYIACLVRYDDGRVARFRRHETNWEHLYRIEASPHNPASVDFRSLTQKFDKVWYGNRVRGIEDVEEFKEVYKRLCEALQIKSAA
jgi:hypothetical protein